MLFAVLCSLSQLMSVHCVNPLGVIHWGKKGVVAGVHKSVATAKAIGAKASFFPIVGAKKALLLAPITIPLAIGGKAILAAKLAVPMGIGAAIGAPIGALIGAKAGALKGALIGKALIAAKLALAKKVAVGATALAVKPVVIAAGLKAKAASAGIGLLGKGVSAAGSLVTKAGDHLKSASHKINGFTTTLHNSIRVPTFSLPQFSLPSLPVLETKSYPKGPTSVEYSLVMNGPHTGYHSKKGSLYSSANYRRRREAQPDPAPQASANAQQLLQLVRSQNAQQCLQRVICELTANPNSHGNDGVRFGRSLILLESQTDRASAQQYRQAATTGSQVQNEQFCTQFFPTCAFQSGELIRLG
ncbi:unnamed protein product, partial [Medioppia subpectinata]